MNLIPSLFIKGKCFVSNIRSSPPNGMEKWLNVSSKIDHNGTFGLNVLYFVRCPLRSNMKQLNLLAQSYWLIRVINFNKPWAVCLPILFNCPVDL